MKFRRKRKLIKSALQLKLVGAFMVLGGLAALFQVMLLNWSLLHLADRLPADGDAMLQELPYLLMWNVGLTLAFLMPVMLLVGILVTHRVAGPVYRFETYLGQVARGEDAGPCRVRKDDELQELCGRINEAVGALRAGAQDAAASPASSGAERAEAGRGAA